MTLRLVALSLLVGCGPDNLTSTNVNQGDSGLEQVVDNDAPVIVTEPITETQVYGEDVPVSATITDEGTGVLFAYLYYKNEIDGAADWQKVLLVADADLYSGTISGADERGGGVDYYLEALDHEQNTTDAPDHGASDPYHFRIAE